MSNKDHPWTMPMASSSQPLADPVAIRDAATNVRSALVNMGELWDVYVEAAAGYKARLEAAGFSTEVAEAMTIDFHRNFLNTIS